MNNRIENFNTPSAPPITYPWLKADQFENVPRELKDDVFFGQKEIIKQGMENHEARVCLILDVSASMQNPNKFFKDEIKGNQVQKLINKTLALAFLFDDNQKIEVFPFGDVVFTPIVLDRQNFTQATDLIMQAIGNEFRQSTNYAEPVKAIREYYFNDRGIRSKPQACADAPVFALFITDGEPNEKKREAMNEFASASHLALFFKFIALKGYQTDLSFSYLQNIDDHAVKTHENDRRSDLFFIDNSDLVVLNHPDELTMEKLIHEYRPWLCEAKEKNLLTYDPGIRITDIQDEGRITAARVSQSKNSLFHGSVNKNHELEKKHSRSCCTII